MNRYDEQTVSALRSLYSSYGYQYYKVSKFESYDLYAQNKNFLQSKRILTFNDTNGRLMALKPDVTLSIIKNTKPEAATSKVYYTENVYRVPKNGDGFQEILQTGLELIGKVDDYAVAEVLMLAERSLRSISPDYVLDISHIGVLNGLLSSQALPENVCTEIMNAAGEKNLHALRTLCSRYGLPPRFCSNICTLVDLYGPLEQALDRVEAMELPAESCMAVRSLRRMSRLLEIAGCKNLRLDFSLVNDMNYYNGIVFRGFISGISSGVLSGGRYDNLLTKMGREQDAIGFAVSLDHLERLYKETEPYDVDILLSYQENCDEAVLIRTAQSLIAEGKTVSIRPAGADGIRAKKHLYLEAAEVRELD